jgi:anti-repressor protein
MTDIVPLNFEANPVRVEDRGGQTWFVASDVCSALDITNVGNALSRLDDDERDSIRNPDANRGRGNPDLTVINESGMYSLILRSRKAAAKRFRKWVTSEVLPAIRRTGAYGRPAAGLDLTDPAVLHRLLLDHTGRAMALEQRVEDLAPKAAALDRLTDAEGALCITDAAKALGQQPRKLFTWLEQNSWIYRRPGGSHWIGYQVRITAGLLEHKVKRIERRDQPDQPPRFVEQVLVTPKGVAKLAEMLAPGTQTPGTTDR